MNITKPIIRKIKDNETALAEFEKEIKTNEAEDTKDIIMNISDGIHPQLAGNE